MVRPEGFEPPVSAFGGPRVIQLRYGRTSRARTLGRGSIAWDVFKQIEFVIHESSVEFTNAVRMSEEVRTRISQVVTGAIRDVV